MKINVELLKQHIEDGYVISQVHPTMDLTIYNYSQFAQYESKWDEVTLMCRGLILDKDFNIVQRPFGKFFNLTEHDSEFKPDIPNLPFEVYDKMDGSLGILYWDADGVPNIASRGSFTSEQSEVATHLLHTKYKDAWSKLDKNKTYIFEIIYNHLELFTIEMEDGSIRKFYENDVIETKIRGKVLAQELEEFDELQML